jgi:hypothetical protein
MAQSTRSRAAVEDRPRTGRRIAGVIARIAGTTVAAVLLAGALMMWLMSAALDGLG